MLKRTWLQEKEEVCRLNKIIEREQQDGLTQHDRFFDQPMNSVRSIRKRFDIAEKQPPLWRSVCKLYTSDAQVLTDKWELVRNA